jgi:hypothetical protein
MLLLLQIAYTLLTLAFLSGVVAAVIHLENDHEYAPIPGLLLLAIATNLIRRKLAPVDINIPTEVFVSRWLFFVWPVGVLFVLLHAFNKPRLTNCTTVLALLLIIALWAFPRAFDGGNVVHVAQGIATVTGIGAIALLLDIRKRQLGWPTALETAAVFCAVGECIAVTVGHFLPGTWWPAVIVYCVLYLALILLHARALWTPRQTLPASQQTSRYSSNDCSS